MAISPSRQRNAVSVGIALGLVELERVRFEVETWAMSMAFEDAWLGWGDQYRARFSQVGTDLRNGSDGYLVMTRADENKQVPGIFWRRDRNVFSIVGRPSWSGEDWDAEALARLVDGDVSVPGWVSLASAFIATYDRGGS